MIPADLLRDDGSVYLEGFTPVALVDERKAKQVQGGHQVRKC